MISLLDVYPRCRSRGLYRHRDPVRRLWTTPRTWIPGELVTALMMNTHIRDNLNYLKALLVNDALAVTLVDGATPLIDASLGSLFRLAAAGNRTLDIPINPRNGQKIVIEHFASSADRTLALNSGTGGFRFGADITSLTATLSGKTDYIGCIFDNTDNKWDVVAVAKGF